MGKFVFLLCASIVCIFPTFSKECSKETLTQFFQCLDQAHQAKVEAKKPGKDGGQGITAEMQQKFEKEKQQMDACFKENGCKIPDGPLPGGLGHHGPPGSSGSSEGSSSEEGSAVDHACLRAIRKKLDEKIKACVSSKTGMAIPIWHGPRGGPAGAGNPPPPPPGSGNAGPPGGDANGHLNFLVQACSASKDPKAAVQKVQQCHEAIRSQHELPPHMQIFCQAKRSCDDGLTQAGCSLSDVKKAIHDAEPTRQECEKQELANFHQLAAGIEQCKGDNSPKDGPSFLRSSPAAQGPPNGRGPGPQGGPEPPFHHDPCEDFNQGANAKPGLGQPGPAGANPLAGGRPN